ncbi:hypothetical protein SH139x_004104 [Planctomycetaceae bacterium SH139]
MDVPNTTVVDLPSRSRLGCAARRRLIGKRTLLIATLWALNPLFASAQSPANPRLPKRLPAIVAQATLGVVKPRPSQPLDSTAGNSSVSNSAAWSAPRPIGRLAAASVTDEAFPRLNPPGQTQADAALVASLSPNISQLAASQLDDSPPSMMPVETVDWGTLLDESAAPATGPVIDPQASTSAAAQAPTVWQVYINTPPALPAPQATPITVVNMPPPAEPEVVDLRTTERQRIASLVSRNNRPQPVATSDRLAPLPASESLTVIQLLRDSEQKRAEANRLLQSGASYAAHAAAVDALRSLAAAADLRAGGKQASQAVNAALESIREAGDFMGRYGDVETPAIERMVASHRTPVLKGYDLTNVTPLSAADNYLDYAREQFTIAAAGQPEAAQALVVLGNAERKRGEHPQNLRDSIAISCLRAAVGTNPQNPYLASELGYHAMQLGLLGEARWALEHSLALQPSRPALQNLIETHRLAGNQAKAIELAAQLQQTGIPASQPAVNILQVSPEVFASISPPVQSGSPVAPIPGYAQQPFASAAANTTNSNGQTIGSGEPVQRVAEGNVLDRVTGTVRSWLQ